MSNGDWQSFTIDVNEDGNGGYTLQVSCPEGEGVGSMQLPLTYPQLEGLLSRWKMIEANPDYQRTDEPGQETLEWSPEQLGYALFEALFPREVHSLYDRCRAKYAQDGLRLLLRYNPADKKLADMGELPWEIMNSPQTPCPVALERKQTFVRYLEAGTPPEPLPLPPRLNVLVVLAEPTDMEPFGREDYVTALRNAFKAKQESRHVTIEFLKQPTIGALREYLLHNECHVLHFMGHGGWDGDTWTLAFENDEGKADLVSGTTLATTLNPALKSLRLVSLVSCEGARAEPRLSRFNGVAHTLVQAGLPAVLAMQFPMSFRAAEIYTRAFYKRLVKGDPIDQAVDEARFELFKENRHSIEWGTPVLFMRTSNGIIFSPQKKQYVHINTVFDKPTLRPVPKQTEIKELNYSHCFKGGDRKSREVQFDGAWDKILTGLKRLQHELNPEEPVCFEGKSWLSVWTALGHVFCSSAGFQVELEQFNFTSRETETWTTALQPKKIAMTDDRESGDFKSKELVVTVAVSREIESEVEAYLEEHPELQYRTWLRLRPDGNPSPDLLTDNQQALDLAYSMAEVIRQEIKRRNISRTHLFLAAPSAFAFFLAHFMTLTREIQVYEYQDPGYEPSFLLKY